MKTRFKFELGSKEVIKAGQKVTEGGLTGTITTPSVEIPPISIDIELEYTPQEIVQDWTTLKTMIKDLPEVFRDLQTAFNEFERIDQEECDKVPKLIQQAIKKATEQVAVDEQ